MSFEFDSRDQNTSLDFSALIEATRNGKVDTASLPGRRARRRAIKGPLSQAGIVAALMAVEGCKTLDGKGSPLGQGKDVSSGGGSGSGGGTVTPSPVTPPPVSVVKANDDSNFSTDTDSVVHIAVNDLLANDDLPAGGVELVRVFAAAHGTVMIHNGMVMFTPEAGYEGAASFRYEVRDANGNLSQATVDIEVGMDDSAGHGSDGHDHGDMGGDGGMDDMPHVHPDDPSKASEHMAMLALVPVDDATHVAVNNGSWFDPATWAGGEVPGEGARVVIPAGVTVDYDGESTVSLFTVRVDGTLDFATDVDTFMEVDTFVVTPSGHLTIGTADHPVDANVKTVIQIADNGPIDVDWDPQLLSRGLLSHGEIEIHGAQKAAFLKVAVDAMAGNLSLTLEEAPEGWQVGDKLVLTGTHLTAKDSGTTEDEELTITRIEGNVVYFDQPLQFNHETPRDDLKAYVANYSRNIVITTENSDSVPVHQRGHVMLMHSDNIDVRHAEFYELGRTDKSERAFDAASVDHMESDTNVKARYSLHLHRISVADSDDPAYLVGNAVWGSPGWGFVQHDSNAILADNAAYDVYGAAFVAETGNETGRWSHNISIKTIGNGGGAKDQDDVLAFDLGRNGAGFWFQGRLVDAVDNVAAGAPAAHGFVYMSRGNAVIPVDPDTADLHESLRYLDEVFINYPAISEFSNNESIATQIGLEVIKAGPEQQHDVRSLIEGFTAWEVSTGIHLQYTAHYTIIDADLIATDQSGGAGAPWRGIEYGPNTIDMVINGASIEGFPTGFYAMREAINMNYPFDGDWAYVFIDVKVAGATTSFANPHSTDLFLNPDQLVDGRLLYDSDINGIPVTPTPESQGWFDLSGVKTDSIGEFDVSPTWDPIRHNYFTVRNALVDEGYWTLPDGRKVTVLDQYYTDRATGNVDKVAVVVEWERNFSDVNGEPHYNGVLDLDSLAPVARTDFATVGVNNKVIIDVLANDYDPDGDDINVDGIMLPNHGSVYQNDDGTITYVADPNYSGTDEFWYWVEDSNGNFDKGHVLVTVEV